MARGLATALALISALAGCVSATYFTYNDVMELNAGNFDNLVINSDGVALVHFYAATNPACKTLASRINAVAGNLKGIALVGAVDCADREASGSLCQRYGIRTFPSVKLFGPDRTKNPYTGESLKEPSDYAGDRTSKDLVDAVTRLLTDVHVSRIRDEKDLKEILEAAAGKAQVLLFSDKVAVTSLFKGLSMQLRKRGLAFAQVHSSAEQVVAEFGVKAFPTLLVVKPDGGIETYTGEVKAPALREFLLRFATAAEAAEEAGGSGGGSGGGGGGKGADGKAAPWSFVRQVEGLGELAALQSREDMALLAVHGAEGEDGCEAARQAFLSAAGEMQAVVDTLLVSVPAADRAPGSEGAAALSRIGVEVSELAAEPCELQVVLLPFGEDKAEDSDIQLKYTGPPDGKELQRWVTGEVPNLVTEVLDAELTPFLLMDPSEGKMGLAPKVLLFTNKDEAPGVFRALAVALRSRGNMVFGWVQANSPLTKSTVNTFKPPRVPALVVVMPNIEPDDEDPTQQRLRFGLQPYFGPLKFSPMLAFLEELASQIEMASGTVSDPEVIQKTLPQITTQDEFQSYCTDPAGMCVLALLDGAAASFEEERKNLLAVAMHQSRSNSALHFVWIDARKHRSVMQAFRVMTSDLPVLVALSARRMRFGLLQSSPTDDSGKGPRLRPELVAKLVDDVLSARIKTEQLQALPEIREGDDAADVHTAAGGSGSSGDDAAEAAEAAAPVEEEFDLNEILSEEVQGGSVGGTKAERLQEIEEQIKAEEEARKAAEQAAKKSSSKKKKKSKKSKSKASSEEL